MARMGKDTARLLAADLAPIDEFHVGGLEATQTVAARLASVRLRGVAGDAGVTPGW
jgi:hypothetical protein